METQVVRPLKCNVIKSVKCNMIKTPRCDMNKFLTFDLRTHKLRLGDEITMMNTYDRQLMKDPVPLLMYMTMSILCLMLLQTKNTRMWWLKM